MPEKKPPGYSYSPSDTSTESTHPKATYSVTPDATTIEATSGAGLFYGLQTLIQLADGTDTITAVDITDSPRFGYRGMMLDISRHYRDKNSY